MIDHIIPSKRYLSTIFVKRRNHMIHNYVLQIWNKLSVTFVENYHILLYLNDVFIKVSTKFKTHLYSFYCDLTYCNQKFNLYHVKALKGVHHDIYVFLELYFVCDVWIPILELFLCNVCFVHLIERWHLI